MKQGNVLSRVLVTTAHYLYVIAFVLFLLTLPVFHSLYVLLHDGSDATYTHFVNRGTRTVSVRAADDVRLRFYFFAGAVACVGVGVFLTKSIKER